MKIKFAAIFSVIAVFLAMPIFAIDLHQARSSGLVGEKLDGYAAALSATPEVNALVADVNAKRLQEYQRISKQNGQPVDVVAKLAAQQIITNLEAGSHYQASDGTWKVR